MATRRIGNITVNYTPNQAQTQVYDMIGRDTGQTAQQQSSNPWDDFWAGVGKKFNSAENATMTTLSVAPSMIRSGGLGLKGTENMATEDLRKDNKARMNDVAKKYGFNSYQELWNKYFDAVDNDTDKEFREKYETVIAPELDAQADENAEKTWDKASDYQNYLNEDYAAKKIAQDRGKFAGSALNTLSTAYDIASMASGIPNGFLTNGVQGAVEGFADELEQNGLENFDWSRAGKNAAIGAASGAATGAFNAGLGKLAAKNGGQLIKGSGVASKLTNGVLNSGIGRGAMSGAVGGFAGGLTSGITNGEDAVSSLQSGLAGAGRGAISGAVSGGITSAANKLGTAIAKRTNLKGTVVDPITGKERQRTLADKLHENTQTWKNWKDSGDTFKERFINTRDSGDSVVGNIYNNYKYAASMPDSEDGYMQGYVTMPSTSADWKRIKNDTQGMIRDISNRVDELNAQEQNWMEAPWRDDALEYGELLDNPKTRKIIDQLELTTNPNMAQAAAITQYLKENGIISDGIKTKRGFAMLPNTSADWKEAKMAEEARSNGMSVLKSMSKAELQDELRNFDYPEEDIRGLSKKDMIEVLDEILPYGAEAYAGGNNSTGRVDAEEYVRSLTADSLRDWMINEEGYSPDRVPKSKQAMLNRLEKDFVLQDLYGTSYKPNSKYQQEYLIEGQSAPQQKQSLGTKVKNALTGFKKGYIQLPSADDEYAYTNALNQALNDNLSGPELSDAIADYSGLPAKVNRTAFNDLITDPDVYNAAREVANYYKSMGDDIDITLDDLAGDLWNEVRAQYATNLYSQAPTTNDNRPDVYAPDTNAYSDDINNMRINRNDMLDSSADAPETALYRQLTGDQERAAQTIPMAQSAGDSWDGLAREYGYRTYDDAVRAFAAANPNTPITAGAVTTWLDSNQGGYNPNATVAVPGDNALESAFENKAGTIQKRNKLQELGNVFEKAGESTEYGGVYDSMDAKTAQKAAINSAPQKLAELGVKPRDYAEYAKTSSFVNNAVTQLAEKSGVKVNLPGLADELAYENIDAVLTPAYKDKYETYIRQLSPDGGTPDSYSAGYLLKESRRFGDLAAKLDSDGDAGQFKNALNNVKYTLRGYAADSLDNAGVTGEAINDQMAQGLRDMGANEKVVNHYTQAKDGKAPKAGDYIYRSSTFEEARNMGRSIEANKYKRSASTRPTNISGRIWRAVGGEQIVEPLLEATVSPIAGKITKYAGKGINKAGTAINNIGTNSNFNSGTTLANIIGREVGLENIPQEAQQYIEAASNLDTAIAADPNVAVSDVNTPSSAQTAVYDTLSDNTGTSTGTTGTTGYGGGAGGYFSSTGNDQLDLLGRAMELAMEADDATAFGTLYDMYNSYAKSLTSGTTELNATQQNQLAKIQSASDAIDELEDLFIGATGGKGPIRGNLQGWAGVIGLDNGAATYNDSREGIAATIAQALGGSRTEGTTKRIAAMLPQLTDSQETAATKLETLRKLLSDAQNNYASAYGVASY